MIDERMIQQATEDLYSAALRRVPGDTKAALSWARDSESNVNAGATLDLMVKSAMTAETTDTFVCSDSGVPVVLQAEWRDFPSHFRPSRMRVADFWPLTAGIDPHGNSIHERLAQGALNRRSAILERLDERRAAATPSAATSPISGQIHEQQ